jgi:basic membrane lipoprotein Med (substrate-binding protein (PBP1-ABC) superfamily)
VALAGCWNGRLLYSYEPPFWSSLGDPGQLRYSMAASALEAGYVPRFDISASAEPVATLSASLASGAYSAAVVGPLLSLQWADFVPRFPRTRFVLIDAPPPAGPAPPNAVFLRFDRTAAFREAGRAAGGTPGEAAGSRPLVGILSCNASDLSEQEIDAFARGVAEDGGGELPREQTLGASPDPKDIRAAVAQMRSEGVSVFLLGLGERNPDGLEAVRDAGARAVVSDWRSSGPLPSQVLASVEEEVTAGVRLALRALTAGTPRVEGPVRVVSGKKL